MEQDGVPLVFGDRSAEEGVLTTNDQTVTPRAPIVDLSFVETVVHRLASGASNRVDLSPLVQDAARHGDLVASSALAWWLLSTDADASKWTIVVPAPGSSPLRHLARAGVITAAVARGTSLVHQSGEAFEMDHLHADRRAYQQRIPGLDWAVHDETTAFDRLRIVDDLSDPRRSPPRPPGNSLAYPWLGKLGLASNNISPDGYARCLANADEALIELIDNVHRWSESSRGFAIVSCTRGGGAAEAGPASWNRLHIVIADSGIGIPSALRKDLAALEAVRDAAQDSTPLDAITDHQLVERLLVHAFGDRHLPNHNGHGLNAAQVRAGQWVGALDVFTVDSAGSAMRKGSRGLSNALETDDHPNLSGASGTLVHLMLQATDRRSSRSEASDAERIPFVDLEVDHDGFVLPARETAAPVA